MNKYNLAVQLFIKTELRKPSKRIIDRTIRYMFCYFYVVGDELIAATKLKVRGTISVNMVR